jgi:hypothetical protein
MAFRNLSSATSASLSASFTNTPDSASSAPTQAQVECYEQGVVAQM